MNVKGKLVKYSLAAAIVSTSFAGIPFSEKGLANHLAAQTAYAADAGYSQQAAERFTKVYAALNDQGKAKVETARQAIIGLDHTQRVAIAGPIANKFSVSEADRGVLADLVVALLSVPTVLDAGALEDIRTNTAYRAALKSAAASAGVTNTSAVTVEAVAKAAVDAEASIGAQLKSKSLTELIALAKSASERNALISNAINQALSASDVAELRQLFQTAGVTGDDFVQSVGQLRTAIGTAVFDDASEAIALAYLSTLDTGTSTNPDNTNTTVIPGQSVEKQFDDLIAKLENATDAEKQKIVQQAFDLFLQTIKGSDSLSIQATVVDGVATADPSKDVLAKLDAVIAAAAKLQAVLKAAKSDGAIPVQNFTVDLGRIEGQAVNFKLSDEAMKKLNASPFGHLNVVFNGLTIGVPNNSEYGKSLDLSVKTSDSAIEGIKAVSSVYDFELSLGGKAVTEFTNPIVLRIPLGNLDGVDKELLSVAKIVDGKLQFQGGKVDGDVIVESRETFSSYVVAENKVSFSDIDSVKAWAGRQIEVLAAKGAISGRSDNKFDPAGNVTRAEFAKMLIRALDLESSGLTSGFKDVKSSDWFAPYVAVAAKKGIITGRSADTFAPNATITRAEMATMIARALRLTSEVAEVKDVDGELGKFSDANAIHASLKEGVALAASNNIILGNAGKFNPNNNATRAEAAVILYRSLQVK